MTRAALDTNCFIDAINPTSPAHPAMKVILAAWTAGGVEFVVSRHTLNELERKPDAALALAQRLEVLPHYPVGAWMDQVAAWEHIAGTWADAKRNQDLQQELEGLAKAGNDIRDRGAYIDALRAGVDVFVTSDSQLAGSAPAARIEQRFGLRVSTAKQYAIELAAK